MFRRAAVLVCLVAAATPGPARAQAIEGGMPRAGEPSWADYVTPERRVARQLRRDGLVLLLDALDADSATASTPEVLYDRALLRFERARLTLPDDPDLLYFRAVALSSWHADLDGDGVDERRTDEAIAAFEELRRVAPEHHPDRVAFELALLHARRSELREAIAEYERVLEIGASPPSPLHYDVTDRERALARLFQPQPRSIVHLNLAEALMLIGDAESLARAVEHYRRASEVSTEPLDHCLALWGLALTLDRSGEHREALATAQHAIDVDPVPDDVASLRIDHRAHGPMAILHSTLVFFEPAHEVRAYDALGWEAMARRASGPANRAELLGRALRAWREFLASGGNAGPYAPHAHRAVERLETELAPAPQPARAIPRPRR